MCNSRYSQEQLLVFLFLICVSGYMNRLKLFQFPRILGSRYTRKVWFLEKYLRPTKSKLKNQQRSLVKPRIINLGDPGLKTLRLSPWRLNLHTKWGREGNGMWCRGHALRKQIYYKNFSYLILGRCVALVIFWTLWQRSLQPVVQ